MTSTLGRLTTVPALDRPDLLAPAVVRALEGWEHAGEIGVTEIDPSLADTAACAEAYDLPMSSGANCVVISGKRAGEERLAACLVRADTRADVNGLVKRTLDVRKCSFHPLERAVEETGMEYGGITPLGLPESWRLLVDAAVPGIDVAVIGSGLRRSKLLVPALLGELPGPRFEASPADRRPDGAVETHISSWVIGSPPKSRPSARLSAVSASTSSSLSSKPSTSRFSRWRDGVADFGSGSVPRWTCQRRMT